jgi:hypothetical protein
MVRRPGRGRFQERAVGTAHVSPITLERGEEFAAWDAPKHGRIRWKHRAECRVEVQGRRNSERESRVKVPNGYRLALAIKPHNMVVPNHRRRGALRALLSKTRDRALQVRDEQRRAVRARMGKMPNVLLAIERHVLVHTLE